MSNQSVSSQSVVCLLSVIKTIQICLDIDMIFVAYFHLATGSTLEPVYIMMKKNTPVK